MYHKAKILGINCSVCIMHYINISDIFALIEDICLN